MLSFPAFLAALLAYLYLYRPQDFDPGSQFPDTPQEQLRKSYDFIIVGGGTSGCVLANRLTENADWSVLVIEAGGDENELSRNPLLYGTVYKTDLDWNFTTTAQTKICLGQPGGKCSFSLGHVLGGSSVIDSKCYARGNYRDYNEWENMGNIGWNWNTMLHYYRKLENCQIPSCANSPYRGTTGPWPITYPNFITKLREEYIRAGQEFGFKKNDNSGGDQYGVGYTQLSLDGVTAASTASTYLKQAIKRKNLTLIKRSLVSKILINFENGIVEGVEYIRNGKKCIANANREVILSAGTVLTPKLLILSGIGPIDELRKLNISPKIVLPVGKNMQDQFIVELVFEINQRLTITTQEVRTNKTIAAYTINKQGPMATTGEEAAAFFNTQNSAEQPNVGIAFISWVPLVPFSRTQNRQLITLRVGLLYPNSTGSVTLKSSSIYDPPLINPNYLSSRSDIIATERGVKTAFEFLKTPTMMKYSPKLSMNFVPECEDKKNNELISCLIKYGSYGLARPIGTARMGPYGDNNSVVDYKDLRVKGLKNLRVIDGSVIPHSVTGNSLMPTIAVAERGADIIKNDYRT